MVDGKNWIPLAKAIDKGNMKIIRIVLQSGTNPNSYAEGTLSPLNRAIFKNKIEIMTLLIENGADVNLVDGKKWTPWQ